MKRTITGFTAAAVLASWLVASPVAAIGPSFFQGYVSAGAMLVRTGNPGDFSRGALLSLNFNPNDFSPAEAQALFLALRGALAGGSINAFSPNDIATAGATPVQANQAIQDIYLNDFSISEFYTLVIYRRQPGGLGIDLYLFFAPNDYRYATTLQF
jgi:hypothetical protein